MTLKEPSWWYTRRPSWQARLLAPAASVYGWLSCRRIASNPAHRAKLPVLCVGNFTAGGTGKTPLALALADIVRDLGRDPVFLSRGYGGRTRGPVVIDTHDATAAEFGDEPLLLARAAPTVIARDRASGARLIEDSFPASSVILMDDGFQNPALAKDFAIVAVDVRRLFGNRCAIPSGPLRAPLACQIPRADAILLSGTASSQEDLAANAALKDAGFTGPVIRGAVAPSADAKWLKGAAVVAYAGIANPDRFFALLESQGARLVARRTFADHHAFDDRDARAILDCADATGARLVTTEKDFVRLYGTLGPCAELRERTLTLPIALNFSGDGSASLTRLIADVLKGRAGAS